MFAKGLWGYLPANILQGLLGFASLSLFTRLLSPEDYGRYALALGVSSLAHTVIFTWLEAAIARFSMNEYEKSGTVATLNATLFRLYGLMSLGLLVIGVLLWFVWPIKTMADEALRLAVCLSLSASFFRAPFKLIQEQKRALGLVSGSAQMDMAFSLGSFILGLVFIKLGLGGGGIIFAQGIVCALILPFAGRRETRLALQGAYDGARLKPYLAYGLPVSASLILTLALFSIDRWLIASYLGEALAGAYHAGFSLASRILDILFIWLGAAGGPALIAALEKDSAEGLKQASRQQFDIIALLSFPATGGLIMVAPALSVLLIGEQLRDQALAITPLISLGGLCSGLTTYYFLQSFTLARKTHLLTLAMTVPAVSNILLNLWLIPHYGLIGAALASFLSFLFGLIFAIFLGHYAIILSVSWRNLLKIGFSTGIMMTALSFYPPQNPVLDLMILSLSGAVIYGACIYGFDVANFRDFTKKLYDRLKKVKTV